MLSWLEGAFAAVLNMSIAAAVITLAVLLARLLLHRAPKAFSYALWAVVLFRLLCPVSVGSAVSLLGVMDAPAQENHAVYHGDRILRPARLSQPARRR